MRRWMWCGGLVGVFLTGVAAGQLNDGPPVPYVRVSEDGGRVLVMRSGVAGQVDRVEAVLLGDGRKIETLAAFPASGVYSVADGSLVYPIGWYCWDEELVSSGDLRYLMRSNRHGLFEAWALKFYDAGVETKSYAVEELLTGFRRSDFMRLSTDWWYYPWHEAFHLDGDEVTFGTPERKFLGFEIGYSEALRFDLKDGELLERVVEREGFLWRVGGLCVGIVLLIGAGVWAVRRVRGRTG